MGSSTTHRTAKAASLRLFFLRAVHGSGQTSRVGSSRVGSGRVGSGRVGSGRVGVDQVNRRAGTRCPCRSRPTRLPNMKSVP